MHFRNENNWLSSNWKHKQIHFCTLFINKLFPLWKSRALFLDQISLLAQPSSADVDSVLHRRSWFSALRMVKTGDTLVAFRFSIALSTDSTTEFLIGLMGYICLLKILSRKAFPFFQFLSKF